jgi:hypothetical protein
LGKKVCVNIPDDIKDLDPTPKDVAENLWGEAGSSGYQSASVIMRERNGGSQGLDESQKLYLRPHFGDLVDRVVVIYNARMMDQWKAFGKEVNLSGVDTAAQTYCNRIYVRDSYQPNNFQQIVTLAHEMTHSRQCEQLGGEGKFGFHYFREYKRGGLSYENNKLEREASGFEERFASVGPFVKLRNRNWGRCLNLQSATQNGVKTNVWDCVSHPDQEWKIENAGNGFVKLRNRNWGRCLNLQSATQNGVKTNVWDCVSHPDQEWKIENAGNGFVKLRNRNWGRCLNLQSATQNGVETNAWDCVSHPDQEWKSEGAS